MIDIFNFFQRGSMSWLRHASLQYGPAVTSMLHALSPLHAPVNTIKHHRLSLMEAARRDISTTSYTRSSSGSSSDTCPVSNTTTTDTTASIATKSTSDITSNNTDATRTLLVRHMGIITWEQALVVQKAIATELIATAGDPRTSVCI